MSSCFRRAGVVMLAGVMLASVLVAGACTASTAAAESAPKAASAGNDKALDLSSLGPITDTATEPAKFLEGRRDEKRPPPGRKLQLQGLGVKYQVNRRTAIESGIRLGIEPGRSGSEQSGTGLPSQGSTGLFIKLQRQLGAR